MEQRSVLVAGVDEDRTQSVVDQLAGHLDAAVQAAAEPAAATDASCVVWTGPLDADVAPWASHAPVVGYGSADSDAVATALAGPFADYVPGAGGARLLAHRVQSVGTDPVRLPADGSEAVVDPAGMAADALYVLDADGTIRYANDALVELTCYDRESLVGMAASDLTADDPVGLGGRRSTGAETTVTTHRGTVTVYPAIGDPVTCNDHARLLRAEDGTIRGVVGTLRETGVDARRGETITQLQQISRDLMQAPSRESVADVAASAVERVLGYSMAAVRLYDAETQQLHPVAVTDAVAERMGERPTYSIDEGNPGRVFASGEPAVYDDVRTAAGEADLGPVRAAMYIPIGVHGTLSIGAETVGAFDEVDRQVAALLATNAAAACNRARREQEVRQARERIETILDRIEGLVQDAVEVLVEARTREDVERGICEQLAAADPYVFAWLARPDIRLERLRAAEWAGDAAIDVDDHTVSLDSATTGAAVHRTGDSLVRTIDELEADGQEWVAQSSAAGVEAVMAIPLQYTDSSYGVLYVCADREDAFDRREQVVLDSIGRAVANAINAIESGRILSADQVIELEFTVHDDDLFFGRLSASTDGTVRTTGTVSQEDGGIRVYLSVAAADAEGLLETIQADEDVAAASLVADHEGEALFDVTLTGSLVEVLVDHGAVPTGIESENGVVRYTIELPYEAEARELFTIVEDRYDATDLVGYHEHERPVRTQQEFRAALAERFTDRQQTALQSAYLGGFFEWPREVDGDELADGMDISRPTYHQHLRAAQQKVFEELFDPQA
jgi:PAS domain S-box-containing protein